MITYANKEKAKYITQELAKYWPVPAELMAQYNDGSHTEKNNFGSLYWRNQNNLRHRDDDKPAWISACDRLEWFQNGKLHRDGDKPAIIDANGELRWFKNSLRHRSCGPAVIYPDGRQGWWINSENITEEVRKWLNGEEWQGTPEQIFEFKLRFA